MLSQWHPNAKGCCHHGMLTLMDVCDKKAAAMLQTPAQLVAEMAGRFAPSGAATSVSVSQQQEAHAYYILIAIRIRDQGTCRGLAEVCRRVVGPLPGGPKRFLTRRLCDSGNMSRSQTATTETRLSSLWRSCETRFRQNCETGGVGRVETFPYYPARTLPGERTH
jgi:hypothetical protein